MNSMILRTTTRFMITLLLLFSIFLLLRGHNEPGGGFIGGLVASGSFILYSLAFDQAATRRALRIDTRALIGIGLLVAVLSGMLPLFFNLPFLTGVWGEFDLPFGHIELGTPIFFDIGVYLVVIGVTLTIILTLGEE